MKIQVHIRGKQLETLTKDHKRILLNPIIYHGQNTPHGGEFIAKIQPMSIVKAVACKQCKMTLNGRIYRVKQYFFGIDTDVIPCGNSTIEIRTTIQQYNIKTSNIYGTHDAVDDGLTSFLSSDAYARHSNLYTLILLYLYFLCKQCLSLINFVFLNF